MRGASPCRRRPRSRAPGACAVGLGVHGELLGVAAPGPDQPLALDPPQAAFDLAPTAVVPVDRGGEHRLDPGGDLLGVAGGPGGVVADQDVERLQRGVDQAAADGPVVVQLVAFLGRLQMEDIRR